jgi:hypothetical protein
MDKIGVCGPRAARGKRKTSLAPAGNYTQTVRNLTHPELHGAFTLAELLVFNGKTTVVTSANIIHT